MFNAIKFNSIEIIQNWITEDIYSLFSAIRT